MGYNISAYIERKNNNGEWELVSTNPISSRLKYIFPEYQDFASLTWENISKGLQEKFPQETLPDGKTVCYYSFYTKTLSQLAEDIWYNLKEINPDMGIKNWNFNLNTEAARNVALASVGSIIFLILGIGVFPNDAWKWPEFRKRTRKQSTHSAE